MNLFKKTKWRKKILFISSPITTKLEDVETLDYFAYIVSMLSQKLENVFSDYDLVVKVPEEDANPTDKQIKIIKNTIKTIRYNKDEYEIIIISPYNKTKLIKYIADLCEISKNKVLLIDQGYFTEDEKKYLYKERKPSIPRPPFVQSDWAQGGKIVGETLKTYWTTKGLRSPTILLVKGGIGSEERIKGFMDAVKDLNPNYNDCIIDGGYTRQKASTEFSNFLFQNDTININIIFCTNDAMALGIREVLMNNPNFSEDNRPIIIGYDGIRDFTLPMSLGDSFLYATVDVNLTGQINHLLMILQKVIENELNSLHKKDKYKHYKNSIRLNENIS